MQICSVHFSDFIMLRIIVGNKNSVFNKHPISLHFKRFAMYIVIITTCIYALEKDHNLKERFFKRFFLSILQELIDVCGNILIPENIFSRKYQKILNFNLLQN